MAHRIIRLSISPEGMPEVRRVIDFDGRNSLHDVHKLLLETLSIGDDDHLYAFFLSGQYWDTSTEYVDPRTEGRRADRALLFRLQLKLGQHFVYVYDYGTERRYSLSVVSVTETNVPLPSPVLIESVGEAPIRVEVRHDEEDEESELNEESEGARDPALQKPLELAAAVLDKVEALLALGENASSEETQPLLHELGESALSFLRELAGNLQLLTTIDREFEPELIESLLGIPGQLTDGQQTDLAVRVAEALKFCAPDDMMGEIARAYARAGDRQRALELVLTNLETALVPYIAEYKAGEVYTELGELDAAEAYYHRALAIADTEDERSEAMLRIVSHLIQSGREAEAAAFITQQRGVSGVPGSNARAQLASGRNGPCPCGSGKKYKRCHGA